MKNKRNFIIITVILAVTGAIGINIAEYMFDVPVMISFAGIAVVGGSLFAFITQKKEYYDLFK